MADQSLEELLGVLETAAQGLFGVSRKRMFGCEGLFASGNIFGLVWKHGRIGVRLPNEIAYAEAMKMPGASPWIAGTMAMSHWVLVPEGLHEDRGRLTAWVRRAHALAQNAAPRRASAARNDAPKTAVKRPNPAPAKPVSVSGKASPKPVKKAAATRAVKKAAPKRRTTTR